MPCEMSDGSRFVPSFQHGWEIEHQPGVKLRVCSSNDFYKLISTRLRDPNDASSMVRRQDEALDDQFILDWLEKFEKALIGLCVPQQSAPTGKLQD